MLKKVYMPDPPNAIRFVPRSNKEGSKQKKFSLTRKRSKSASDCLNEEKRYIYASYFLPISLIDRC